jgi:hypothetical protein
MSDSRPAQQTSRQSRSTSDHSTDAAASSPAPALHIDARIRELGDWRGETLSAVRQSILATDPSISEEWKWDVPVWSMNGILCTGEVYKQAVKLTFARGASLPDPDGLFNSSLTGKTRRAIDIKEGASIPPKKLQRLIRAAITENRRCALESSKPKSTRTASRGKAVDDNKPVVLLSGGNPQIAKADGDPPVQAYIAAMPGWKRAIGRQLDDLITRTVPDVIKGVRWNSPMYGVPGQGWFVSFHVLTKYVKLTFFAGRSLDPMPPGATEKSGEARWQDIYENHPLDVPQLTSWIQQAASIPGWTP